MRRSGLGRGLSALLPEAAEAGEVRPLATDSLRPNPFQPRQNFAAEALQELAESIRLHGVMQPILVRPAPDGDGFQVVAGERRWRAAVLAGLTAIPALVRGVNEREMVEMALVENLQREDLNPLEAAEAYRRCLEEFGLTQDELARQLGKSRSAVANTLRLLRLAPAVRALLADGSLSEGHGRALLALVDEDRQVVLAQRILGGGLSVREAERLARESQAAGRPTRRAPHGLDELETPPAPEQDVDLAAFAEQLQRALGTRVELRPGRDGGGQLVLWYYSLEDLERLTEALAE